MKVKEFIEKLKQFDQESNIWSFDDFPNQHGWEPSVEKMSKVTSKYLNGKRGGNDIGVPYKEGDVYIL